MMLMKKSLVLFLLGLLCMAPGKLLAQKTTTVSFQNAQALMPQVLVQPLVQPLVVEAKVMPNAQTTFTLPMTQQKVDDLGGSLESVHNYGVFKFAEAMDADMIVGATFDFHSVEGTKGYELVIRGFPAKFENWHTATKEDYEWMRLTGTSGAGNPVVKSLK